jgi:hypothetical protein
MRAPGEGADDRAEAKAGGCDIEPNSASTNGSNLKAMSDINGAG